MGTKDKKDFQENAFNMNQMRWPRNRQAARYFVVLLLLWMVVGLVLLIVEENRQIYIWMNEKHTPFRDVFFSYFTELGTFKAVIGCLVILLMMNKKWRNLPFIVLFSLCQLFPFVITQILKNIFQRPRPLRYFENADWIHKVVGQPEQYSLSFPSGHSEGVFALACFCSLLLPNKYRIFGVLFFAIALLAAFSRIYLSQHFYEDIYVGSLIGAFGALFVFYWIHHKQYSFFKDKSS